jgi:hypothetical protein
MSEDRTPSVSQFDVIKANYVLARQFVVGDKDGVARIVIGINDSISNLFGSEMPEIRIMDHNESTRVYISPLGISLIINNKVAVSLTIEMNGEPRITLKDPDTEVEHVIRPTTS